MTVRPFEALAALETALGAALKADATLAGLVQGRIHDDAPAALVPPYLAFGEGRVRDWSGGTDLGARATLALEAATADGGRGRARAILDRAVAVALGLGPTLSAGTLVLLRPVDSTLERRRGTRGWFARCRLEALIDG